MPYRKAFALRPVKTVKHEVTWSNLAQDASALQEIILAVGTSPSALNAASEVDIGSSVKSIFFEINLSANVITNPKVLHWKVQFIPNGITRTAPTAYFTSDRRNILHRGMEMLPKDVGTVFKRVFVVKIPRGKSRISVGDKISFVYQSTSAEAINSCGFAIYKEFS